jgi:transcriptional regulator with XRE-family HTH domain
VREVAAHFGHNLNRLRRRASLSQEELAALASLHRTEIWMLERGVRLARIDTVVKLAGGLEEDAGTLFHGLVWLPGHDVAGRFALPPTLRAARTDGAPR